MRAYVIAAAVASLTLSSAGCTLGMYDNHDDDDWIEATDADIVWGDGGSYPWPDAQPPTEDGGSYPWPDAQPLPEDGGTPWPDAGPAPGDGGVGPDTDGGPIYPPNDAAPADFCASIAQEAVCVVTPECDAVYVGVDCECYGDGTCECTSWEFLECR